MDYKYYLPDANGNPIENSTNSNSIVIIGANGTGKSKLGAWMENNRMQSSHRIGAQRSLVFGNYIQQKSYEQATNYLIYGYERILSNHDQRWSGSGERNYTATMLTDYEYALSALLAKKNQQQEEYIAECKEHDRYGQEHNPVPETVIDVLQRIWNSVFPQRDIKIEDGKVIAVFHKDDDSHEYKGCDMSDGERVALYLIAQVLCIPNEKTMIIDEPELHLHRSIMNRLWTSIENERQDCLFVYITHDTQFAANHQTAKKIWTKSYDGQKWDIEEVSSSELPEQLLLDILGNRRNVLFVEGEAGSIDSLLYSEIYKDYYIVPCGGCSKVIERTKAMKESSQLHNLQCYGIIDRDFRCDQEISSLRAHGIYTLNVAEVENLFIIEDVFRVVNDSLNHEDTNAIDNAKNYIIDTRFRGEVNRQVCAAVVSEIKYRLTCMDISQRNEEEAKGALQELYSSISYDVIKQDIEAKYNKALEAQDYNVILTLFNRKSLKDTVGHYFGLNDNEYCNFVVRCIRNDKRDELIDAIRPFLPTEIS